MRTPFVPQGLGIVGAPQLQGFVAGNVPAPVTPTYYIYVDDNDSDSDGLSGAAYFFGVLSRLNPAEHVLKAIIISSNVPEAAAAMRAMADFAGYSHVPVGAYKGTSISGGASSLFAAPVAQAFAKPGQETRDAFQDSVTVMRQALKECPDGSVVIYNGATATDIAACMASPADGIDARSGAQLLAAKVKFVVMCAGNFATSQPNEANLWNDLAAGQALVAQTYMDVIFAGLEHGGNIALKIDGTLADPRDPMFYGWDVANSNTRGGGDQVAAEVAFFKGAGLFGLSPYGTITVASNAVTTFTAGAGRHRYATLQAVDYATAQTQMQADINAFTTAKAAEFGPYVTSPWTIKRVVSAASTYTITTNKAFTATLVNPPAGYSIAGNVVTLPSHGTTGNRTFTLRLTNTATGKVSDQVITDSVVSADVANFLLAEWQFNEGSGETIIASPDTRFNGFLGNSAGNSTQNPTRVAQGLDFSGSGQVAMVPYIHGFQQQGPMDLQSFVASAVFKTDTLTGLHTLIAKHQSPIGDSAWQFRQNGSEFDFVGRGAATSNPVSSGAALTTTDYFHGALRVNGTSIEFYKNGVLVSSHSITNVVPNDRESPMTFGARGPTLTEVFDGIIAYGSFGYDCGSALMPGLYQRAKAAVAAKGITI